MNINIRIYKQMGVPGFFAWLLRKYRKNNIIVPSLPQGTNVKTLFFERVSGWF